MMAVIFAKVKITIITLNTKALGDSHRVARAFGMGRVAGILLQKKRYFLLLAVNSI